VSKSRSKNAILNISFGFIAQIGILILSFVGRRIFLKFLSVEYLGINGLYSNILTVLSLAELGVDTAVLFSLYKPVAENNVALVSSLIRYFRRIYRILAFAVFAFGISLIPFLKYFIQSELSQFDLIIYYILFLTNTVASYFVAHKVALLSAHQEQRIQKLVSLTSTLILQALHIVLLIIWKNYYVYIIATVATTIINNIILGIICGKIHHNELNYQEKIDFDKKPIYKRIYSTFLYKIGSVLVNSTDNILISILINTAAVGLYSNYYTVIIAIQGFISIITTSLISGIGNLSVTGDKKRQHDIFNMLLLFYHFIGAVGFIGFSLLFNDVITIWLGSQFVFNQLIVTIISFNFYLTNAISPVWMYREANGLFDKVKILMLIRAGVNLALSIALGLIWGVFGIFLATTISLLTTGFWYEPKILFSNVFLTSSRSYWRIQSKYFILSITSYLFSYFLMQLIPSGIAFLIVKMGLIIMVSSLIFLIFVLNSQEVKTIKSLIKR
jgi:O-antigen/teichoic acid export membrane protein